MSCTKQFVPDIKEIVTNLYLTMTTTDLLGFLLSVYTCLEVIFKDCYHQMLSGMNSGGAKGRRGGWQFQAECISTIPIGAPIYIWPLAAIPPDPPLGMNSLSFYLFECISIRLHLY